MVNAMSFLDAYGAGRAYREQEDELQRARGLRNTQAKATAALMSGDTNTARQMAMGSGDAQTMQSIQQQIAQMDTAGREAARERVRGLGAVAYTLADLPEDQRGVWVKQNAQTLSALGVDPRQVLQAPLSDQNLAAFIRQAESMDQELFAPYTLGENEARFTASGDQRLNPNAALNRQVDQARLDETIRSNRAGENIDRFEAETGRMGELRQQANAPGERLSEQFGQERQLRSEFQDITADFRNIADQYNVLVTSAEQRNAQGDLALVVAFTKLQDPGSVAREGEVSLSQSTASTMQQASNWLRRLQGGNTLLPDEVRQAFVSAAGELAGQYESSFQRRQQEYTQLAGEYGLNPERVTVGGASLNRPAQQAQQSNEPVQLPSDMQAANRAYAELPSGAIYITPDGQTRQKP